MYCSKTTCDATASGTCSVIPTACPEVATVPETCGCDGNTYSNSCFANGAGVNVDTTRALCQACSQCPGDQAAIDPTPCPKGTKCCIPCGMGTGTN